MKHFALLSFVYSTSLLALGDPSFIPATPSDTSNAAPVDSMFDPTETLDQTEQNRQRQEQSTESEDRFDQSTKKPKEKRHERNHSE